MINPISPEFVNIIHQEKIQKLEREIELVRIEKAQRAQYGGSSFEQEQRWYAQIVQWVSVKLFNRAPSYEKAIVQREKVQEPCAGVPC